MCAIAIPQELSARVADLQRRQDKLETDYFAGELALVVAGVLVRSLLRK